MIIVSRKAVAELVDVINLVRHENRLGVAHFTVFRKQGYVTKVVDQNFRASHVLTAPNLSGFPHQYSDPGDTLKQINRLITGRRLDLINRKRHWVRNFGRFNNWVGGFMVFLLFLFGFRLKSQGLEIIPETIYRIL